MSAPLRLRPTPPFDFAATAASHGWVALAPNAWDAGREAIERVHRLTSRVILLRITGGPDEVRVELPGTDGHPGPLTPAERREVRDAVAHMLRLDEDLTGFHALCREQGGPWAVATRGLGRLLRSPTLFEDAVKTILTTNVQWGGTRRMVRELVEAFGEPHPADDELRAFPTPEAIAAADPEAFSERVGLGYRAPYVHELARRVAAGELDLEGLAGSDLPTPSLERELRGIRGVGPYAAATLLMLIGRYDVLPVDSVFRSFVARRHFGGEAVPDAEARAVYEPWGRWRYLAYWVDLTQNMR